LADSSSLRRQVFYPYLRLIRARAAQRAFHPNGVQQVLSGNESLFALARTSPDGDEKILCVHNVSDSAQPFRANLNALSIQHAAGLRDIISGAFYPVDDGSDLTLTAGPYQVLWLKAEGRA